MEMPYDEQSGTFLEKKTLLFVNLRSASNTTEVRMAGVVTIDVSACLNTNNLKELKKYPLERCPDKNSFLMLSVKSEYMKELSLEDIK